MGKKTFHLTIEVEQLLYKDVQVCKNTRQLGELLSDAQMSSLLASSKNGV